MQWLGIVIVLAAVVYFLKSTIKSSQNISGSKAGAISGMATVIFISLSIICSIKGAAEHISILHALFIRLLVAFVLVNVVFAAKRKVADKGGNLLFFAAVLVGVLVQTIVSNYLWYYASFTIGVAVFQTLIATLPLWVYAIDVYVLKKSKPSFFFLAVALVAGIGNGLLML
ncbi:MAG: EamA family transporter [Chitinophagaceae bacterium]